MDKGFCPDDIRNNEQWFFVQILVYGRSDVPHCSSRSKCQVKALLHGRNEHTEKPAYNAGKTDEETKPACDAGTMDKVF